MGNNSSHKRTKVPKQACKERLPNMDKAGQKQQFSHLKRKKPSAKIVLLFPLDKRQQLADVAAGPGARPGRPGEDATGGPVGSPAAASMLRGAGDGADRREGARAREMKILVLLLLDARLQEEGRCAAGAPGGGAGAGGGATVAPGWQRLYARLLTESEVDREADPAKEQPRKGRRCPRPRP
ncbi:uncharacterized protein C20orf144 homolog [Mirounga angustirostris]|uniref:uncharacterized protein C20orf144 homolog n=1 Tax=Mirounga leonina TaxID=9715 RepID=UPI00156BF87E|nr:uncharacterized protein C20orf144 homolog [Mirounga leonina]XP_045739879.1 uncharacterized protein C20orf144 homolog [Mirounga angustirostris]KAF3824810.1 hypothetical protein GH733_010144 [Mirounga leonina]